MIFSAHFYVTSHPPPKNAITWLFRYKNSLCQTACWTWVTYLISSLQPPCEVGINIIPFTDKDTEVQGGYILAQSHNTEQEFESKNVRLQCPHSFYYICHPSEFQDFPEKKSRPTSTIKPPGFTEWGGRQWEAALEPRTVHLTSNLHNPCSSANPFFLRASVSSPVKEEQDSKGPCQHQD